MPFRSNVQFFIITRLSREQMVSSLTTSLQALGQTKNNNFVNVHGI